MTIITGIGSRRVPVEAIEQLKQLISVCPPDWTVYTGEADGCDETFFTNTCSEVFCTSEQAVKRVLKHHTVKRATHCPSLENWEQAFAIGERFHPAWHKLSDAVRMKIARSSYQVLGYDLNTPTQMIICWTPDGAVTTTSKETGGTGQAIRIANAYGIPVYNLNYHPLDYIKMIITVLEY